uniref:UMA domain-containing protein n=1 Tax=Lygus hesperus TaxID=30085 RepID=A0A0A9YKP5_LYGHE
MNWLFGSKRKPPEVFVADDTPEGFTNVTMRNSSYESPLPPYPPIPRPDASAAPAYPYAAPYPPAPYPPLTAYGVPKPSYGSPTPSQGAPASPYGIPSRPAVTNPLDSVPFVLAPSLTAARTRSRNEFDSYRAQMISLKDKLATTYTYDFSLERSVIQDYSNGL